MTTSPNYIQVITRLSLPLASFVLSVLFQSRAFAIGSLMAVAVVIIAYRKTRLSKAQAITLLTGLVLVLLGCTFMIKTDSSLGRLLIYKIAAHLYRDNWVHGIGLGNFGSTYPHYQAAYFAKGEFSDRELLLADNTYFAFNDYFQFVVETGLLGIAILALSSIALLAAIKKALQNSQDILLYYAMVVLVTICTAASFTYVFNKPGFQLAVAISIGTILFYGTRHIKRPSIRYALTMAILLCGLSMFPHYIQKILEYNALSKLKQARELERTGYRNEAMQVLGTLERTLDQHPEYLEFESYCLLNKMELARARMVTKKLIGIRPSNELYMRLGYIAWLENDFRQTEQAYTYAIHMVPNRFTTRYRLYQSYKARGEKQKAQACADAILRLPVKVPSVFVDQILQTLAKENN